MRLINDYNEMTELRDASSGMLEFDVDRSYRHYDVILHRIGTYVMNSKGGFGMENNHAFTIDIPAEYPLAPPLFKFAKPIFHPNWYPDGKVCQGILRDTWDPAIKLRDLVIDTVKMMTFEIANPNSPANPVASAWYRVNKESIREKIPQVKFPPPEDELQITEISSEDEIMDIKEIGSEDEPSLDITEI